MITSWRSKFSVDTDEFVKYFSKWWLISVSGRPKEVVGMIIIVTIVHAKTMHSKVPTVT